MASPNHYRPNVWLRSMVPYGITKPLPTQCLTQIYGALWHHQAITDPMFDSDLWCCMASPSHYQPDVWLRSMVPYGITKPLPTQCLTQIYGVLWHHQAITDPMFDSDLWCLMASTSHYQPNVWLRSMVSYGITKPLPTQCLTQIYGVLWHHQAITNPMFDSDLWCPMASSSHYQPNVWLRSMVSYGITKPIPTQCLTQIYGVLWHHQAITDPMFDSDLWCLMASPSHYRPNVWLRSMVPYGITKPLPTQCLTQIYGVLWHQQANSNPMFDSDLWCLMASPSHYQPNVWLRSMVPYGINKPLPTQCLTQIYGALWHHQAITDPMFDSDLWCLMASPSHYRPNVWLRSMVPYGITKPLPTQCLTQIYGAL